MQRPDVDLILIVGIVQHHVAVDIVDFGHCVDIARNTGGDFRVFLAMDLEQVADLEGLAAITDEQ